MSKKGYLVLETGEIFEGLWNSSDSTKDVLPRVGEVVFNTSHAGYQEIASDPSYYSQIMVMTASMQGNYGLRENDFESKRYWIEGFVCTEMTKGPWQEALLKSQVPILSEVDTRNLTLRLREKGTPWGALLSASSREAAQQLAPTLIAEQKKNRQHKDWTLEVSARQPQLVKGMKMHGARVALVDFGVKESILHCLLERCAEVQIFPSTSKVESIKDWSPDGVLLSNGPGNPDDVKEGSVLVSQLVGWRPLFGICMGHQVLSRVLGAKTFAMKFGHHGGNHPIRDDLLQKVYITSQNHGYAVDPTSLSAGTYVTHVNLYDGTLEGLENKEKKCWSVQFHPESAPGPNEARLLFDRFIEGLR